MHDGATIHAVRLTIELSRQTFKRGIVLRNSEISCSPRSPDLTAPDRFQQGYLKDRVCRDKPQTNQQLKRP